MNFFSDVFSSDKDKEKEAKKKQKQQKQKLKKQSPAQQRAAERQARRASAAKELGGQPVPLIERLFGRDFVRAKAHDGSDDTKSEEWADDQWLDVKLVLEATVSGGRRERRLSRPEAYIIARFMRRLAEEQSEGLFHFLSGYKRDEDVAQRKPEELPSPPVDLDAFFRKVPDSKMVVKAVVVEHAFVDEQVARRVPRCYYVADVLTEIMTDTEQEEWMQEYAAVGLSMMREFAAPHVEVMKDVSLTRGVAEQPTRMAAMRALISLWRYEGSLKQHVNGVDAHGQTLLMRSAANGVDVVEPLLEVGALVDRRDADGVTALMLASAHGHGDLVRSLIEHKADVMARDNHQRTVLMHAAAADGNDQVVRILVQDAQVPIDERDQMGWTALMHAALSKNAPVSNMLLNLGADCSVLDTQGINALMHAATAGNEDIVRSLMIHYVRKDLSIDSRDVRGRTALMHASRAGHEPVVQILLNYKADIMLQDRIFTGSNAVKEAKEGGHERIVNMLEKAHETEMGPHEPLSPREEMFSFTDAVRYLYD